MSKKKEQKKERMMRMHRICGEMSPSILAKSISTDE